MPLPLSNIHFVVQSLPANEEQFQEKLQSLAERVSFNLPDAEDIPPTLQWLQQHKINQCVVAAEHFAFLLDDGRVCRLRYSAHDPQDEDNAEESTIPTDKSTFDKRADRSSKAVRTGSSSPWLISGTDLSGSGSSALRRWGTHIGVIRSIASASGSMHGSTMTASSAQTRNRPRNVGSAGDTVNSSGGGTGSAGGVRLSRTAQLRGRGLQSSLLTGQRVIVPASHVPEELVNQVQGILQGKSRNIIIRELQRTNLDVNLAVNNLLSRDDDDNDDAEDNGNDYIPGDDLLSLLDSGIHSGEHGVFIDTDAVLPEELLGYTVHRTSRTSTQGSSATGGEGGSSGCSNKDGLQDRDPIIRLRSPRFFEPLTSDVEESSTQSSGLSAPFKKAKVLKTNMESVSLGEEIEWWIVDGEFVKFTQIGAMHSELVAVDVCGTLRQWKWSKSRPYHHSSNSKVFHPRASILNLVDKKVTHLAACSIRASVMVESGGVATWTDDTVSRHACVLEHSLTGCVTQELETTLGSAKWKAALGRCLHVCTLYSVLFTPSGKIYWWGVLPFNQRRKLLEKARGRLKKRLTSNTSSKKAEIKIGSQVCLHSCPMFQAGAVAIHARCGKPKVGRLQQSAWNLLDKCSFKILGKQRRKSNRSEEIKMKVPKKRDGEIVENQSRKEISADIPSNSERETVLKSTSYAPHSTFHSPVKSQKRKRSSSTSKSSKESTSKSKIMQEDDQNVWDDQEKEEEEQWNLQDVVFIEDAQTAPIGKVLKVDEDMAAVWFSQGSESKTTTVPNMDVASILKNCRLLRKDDLHLLSSGSLPKVPECFQRTPKQIKLDPTLKIHSIDVNEMGIKAIEGGLNGTPLTLLEIELSGKIASDCPFPSPPEMFLVDGTYGDCKPMDPSKDSSICRLHCRSQDFPTVLQDNNSTFYPLLRNENWGFRDPRWLNLPPLTSLATGAHVPPHSVTSILEGGGASKSKMLAVTALVFKIHALMPVIIRKDLRSLKDFLGDLSPSDAVAVSKEMCDGKRNIFHVAVAMTAPSANRALDEEEPDKDCKDEKPRYKTIPPSVAAGLTSKGNSSETKVSNNSGVPASKSSSGDCLMTRSEREGAVNAIASAISVVTRGGSSGNTGGTRRTSAGCSSASRESPQSVVSTDPFILPIPYPPNYRPPTSSAQAPAGFSSRFMRDIMQQFAAVLDDHPSDIPTAQSTQPSPNTVSSSSTAVTSMSPGTRLVPSIIRETPPGMFEGPYDTFSSSNSDSSVPANLSRPPDPTAPGSVSCVPQREEGLNLSVSDAFDGSGNLPGHVGKLTVKKPKRKRSLTPTKDVQASNASVRCGTMKDALAIVGTLCTSPVLQPMVLNLLSQRDALGHTPFMSAVYHRGYWAALRLFKQAQAIARRECDGKKDVTYNCDNPDYKEVFMTMIYPDCSDADNNPLYVLCANDTCSFTWTGAQHINQDIFECWTCGLTGTLCCCSECARVCHNGHDCKLKRTSPTAYCDCWEKCACRSLLAGDTAARVELLENLLYQTKLVNLPNARGETMLQFLAQTAARQMVEQRQYRTRSNATAPSRTSHSSKSTPTGTGYDIPQHDLQPPTFCRNAFLMLLNDWTSIRSTVMSGSPGFMDPLCASSILDRSSTDGMPFLLPGEKACLASQTGTSRLDAFTLCLLVKCNTEYLDMLLETFINQVQRTNRVTNEKDDLEVIHRFMRSVVRVFVILSIETQPGKQTGRTLSHTQPLKRAQRAFVTLMPMAIKELCEMATALIDPVRMGVVKPTAAFSLLPSGMEAIQGCETAFSRMPFPPRDQDKRTMKGGCAGPNPRQRPGSSVKLTFPGVHGLTSRSTSRRNFGRRGISRRRSQNIVGSTRVDTAVGGEANNPGGILVDVVSDSLAATRDDDSSQREAEDAVMDRGDYPALTDEEEDVLQEDDRDEDGDDDDDDDDDCGGDVDQEQEADDTHHESSANDSQQEVVSEGDLDMDDDDDDEEVGGDEENTHDGEESDMDMTLLAGTDGDSDVESSQSAVEGGEDYVARRRIAHSRIFLDEDDGDEIIGDDEDDQDGDDDERRTYEKDSLDEGGNATDIIEDNDTSSQEDEQDEDDQDEEDMASQLDWIELPLERAPTRLQRSRATQAPHSMRWALGGANSSSGYSGGSAAASRQPGPGLSSNTGNLIYIDPSSLRRGNAIGIGSSVGSSNTGGGDSNKPGSGVSVQSLATTNAQLARAFGICIREMVGLFTMVWHGEHIGMNPLSTFIELTYKDLEELKDFVKEKLTPTWKWLLTVVDSVEAQLRYGQVLSLAGSPEHGNHPHYKGTAKKQGGGGATGSSADIHQRNGPPGAKSTLSFLVRMAREASNDSNAARQDFLSYVLSLMRAHSGEHSDYLPVMDVSSLRHVAYVLDAMIFFGRETASIFNESTSTKVKKPMTTQCANPDYKFGMSLNLGYDNTDDEEEDEEANVRNGLQDSSSTPQDELYSLAVSDVVVENIISTSWDKVAQDVADGAVTYAQPKKTFFRRSNSMTFPGCFDPDPFAEPLVKALPLADKPHLLQPNARKEELFGRPRQRLCHEEDDEYFDTDLPGMGMGQARHRMPEKFAKLAELQKRGKRVEVAVQTEELLQDEPGSAENVAPAKELPVKILPELKGVDGELKVEEGSVHDQLTRESDELVTIHAPVITSKVVGNSEKPRVKKIKPEKSTNFTLPSADSMLGRCRLTLELFTNVFLEDVGAEPKSILQEFGGFEVRESTFRKEMEKLRNSQSIDLQLNVEREPHRLILQTFKQLNQHYRRRTNSSVSLSSMSQPMAVQRVKVVFKEEPGEGSGVARSFYTALCEALLSSKKLPPLESILVPSTSSSRGSSSIQNSLLSRLRKREQERDKERERARRAGVASSLMESGGRKVNLRSYFTAQHSRRPSTALSSSRTSRPEPATDSSTSSELSTRSRPFHARRTFTGGSDVRASEVAQWPSDKRAIGERLLPKVATTNPGWSEKITGMLLGLPVAELLILLSSDRLFKAKVADAVRRLIEVGYNAEEETHKDGHRSTPKEHGQNDADEADSELTSRSSPLQKARMSFRSSKMSPSLDPSCQMEDSDHESDEEDVSTFPLFYQPGKRGFYSPAAGPAPKDFGKIHLTKPKSIKRKSYEARLNAFRNVGRILGLCLLQNELCPLPFNRHVLKVLLGRKVNWHDFAFFDPVMYESLRYVLSEMGDNVSNEELLSFLDLTFVVNPLPEEGGGEVELVPGGSTIIVNPGNVHSYAWGYTTYRMISCCQKYLDKMREGLFDVIPRTALDGLTPEDFRLLLNGCGRVNVHTLVSYTSFNDESGKSTGSSAEKLTEFKRWFWSVVERMPHSARQELLYFWTGSPALPASEDGFQPMPTVTIRPPDDQHLPTANTCISRLYVPLYSSRSILKQKLQIAIKTKNFGFV